MSRRRNDGKRIDDALALAVIETLNAVNSAVPERSVRSLFENEFLEFSNRIDAAYQGRILKDLSLSPDDYDFDVSESSFKRVLRYKSRPTNKILNSLYIWLYYEYPDYLELEIDKGRLKNKSEELLVREVRKVFGIKEEPSATEMLDFRGSFALYRPFHLRPRERISLDRLSVCLPGSAFACELATKFETEGGVEVEEEFAGKIIRHGNTATIIMASEIGSGVTLHIDHFDFNSDDYEPVQGFSGIMVMAGGNNSNAAFPFYACKWKNQERIFPKLLNLGEIEDVPRSALSRIMRGAVYTDPLDFPGLPPKLG